MARVLANPGHGFCLFPEQRTGKTLIACTLIDRWKPEYLLVVCTKKAVVVWTREIKKHMAITWPCEIEHISYAQLLVNRKQWLKTSFPKNSLMIVDEAQHIKGRKSKQGRLVRTLGRRFDRRLALTGTPIAQGLQDVWGIFDFIDPEIFGPWGLFQGVYCVMGGFKGKQIMGYKNKDAFNRLFHKHSYRITLDEARAEAGMPPVKVRRVQVEVVLGRETRRVYQELEKEMRAEVQKKEIKTPLVITQAMRLHQLCGGHITGPEGEHIIVGNEKINRLIYILNEYMKGKKAIICCRFTWEIEQIEADCKARGRTVSIISGKHKFTGEEAHKNSDIVIMQIQSGVAIDLAFAPNMIFYSWNYSYLDYEQSRFRIVEFKSKRVTYFYLVAKDSIDEIMYEAVTRKKKFAALVIDHYRKVV